MKAWKNKFITIICAISMTISLTGCESYDEWETRKATEEPVVTHIDTGMEGTGPKLADYVNAGVEEAKENGHYTESDYSGIRMEGATDYPEQIIASGSSQETNHASQNASESGNKVSEAESNPDNNYSEDVFGHSVRDALSDDEWDTLLDYLTALEYEGEPYVLIHENIPYFTEQELIMAEAFEFYSELDELKRTVYAFASLDESLMPEDKEERGDISSVKPTGWVQAKYEDIGNGGWLYNRCHLIAWSLAGENDNERNLMTGTRYFNVEGMLPLEMKVLEYMDEHPKNHVLYRASPVYEEGGLLAKGLLLEAYSIEDNGELMFCIYIFNVQPGVTINYQTGESQDED